MTFGTKYSKDSRIEFACFNFHVGLLFVNFSIFKPDTENNANFDATCISISSKRANWLSDSALVSINVFTLRRSRSVNAWTGDRLWVNQPPRSTQPLILPGSINEYLQHAGVKV